MAEQKFEDALEKLEEIVADLESGNLNLDDAIKKYEDGMKIASICAKKLEDTKKKIEILVKDSSGKLAAKEFKISQPEDLQGDDGANEAAVKTPRRKKRPRGEELLF